jgi:hypothetical protein
MLKLNFTFRRKVGGAPRALGAELKYYIIWLGKCQDTHGPSKLVENGAFFRSPGTPPIHLRTSHIF